MEPKDVYMESKYYKDLIVWQKAMDLVVEIYNLSKLLPKTETYALADQMRRAAVSIPSNIAEGQQRRTQSEFANFLAIARGSEAELETQLYICVRLSYLQREQVKSAISLCTEIGKMLNALIKKQNSDY